METIVSGCNDCPLLYSSEECQGDPFDCQHPQGLQVRIKTRGGAPITPDNCPLKKESLTITLKEDNNG